MSRLLDNPVWNALNTGNKNLSEGSGAVRIFPQEVAPFVGLKEYNEEHFKILYDLIPDERVVAVATTEDLRVPEQWKVIQKMDLLQMTCEHTNLISIGIDGLIPLGELHVPQMLDLTRLTNPGPFHNRTIAFGNYYGVFKGNQLVAMAGQRLHAGHNIEISAVCTHPDHLGNGYALALMIHLVKLIHDQNCIPFLHVRKSNLNAIRLFKFLTFTTRRDMTVKVIQKNKKD
jgi:ribosomal protein S18 acetylase RimI-like enzyme